MALVTSNGLIDLKWHQAEFLDRKKKNLGSVAVYELGL